VSALVSPLGATISNSIQKVDKRKDNIVKFICEDGSWCCLSRSNLEIAIKDFIEKASTTKQATVINFNYDN
jgi:hypothetical protein